MSEKPRLASEGFEPVFSALYASKSWGINSDGRGSSGPGSNPEYARPYTTFLREFMTSNAIASVVDLGCGDWQFSRHIDWHGIEYLGIDCVREVVQYNNAHFRGPKREFIHRDILDASLPRADLYILKDVLQHLDNASIFQIIDRIVEEKKARIVLITNCCNQGGDWDDVAAIGLTRPLNALQFPLRKYQPVVLLRFETKQTCAIVCGRP